MEKQMIRNVLNTLGSLRSALAVGVGLPFLVAASAYAQAPKPTATVAVPTDQQALARGTEAIAERVIVTGSYIPTAETESALPVTVYTAEVLQKQGANTPIEGLRQLPSFVGNASTENDSNGGNGQAFINLRALGQENVLTLINGRRAFEFADINAIGIGSLSRTEVLKDGASAIYGSDAVSGVVNFILLNGPGEKPYEGAELNALYGNTTDSDAHVRHVYVRGGVTGLDGKVSIAASGEYYSRANLYSRDRTIATTADVSNDSTGLGFGGINNNSPTYGGRISVLGGATAFGFANTGALVLTDLTNNQVTPGSYRRFDVPAGTDPSRFNFREFTPAIPAVEKAMYYVTGRYKIFGDELQLYGDIMYSHTKQDNGLAGAPFSISSAANGLTDARASVFNPAGAQLASVSYRLQKELGGRRSFFDHNYQRYVVGINGDFNIKDNGFISRFGYDSGFVYEDFSEERIDSGDATRSGLRALIAANLFNPFIGEDAPVAGIAPTYLNGVPNGTRAYDNNSAVPLVENGGAAYIGHSYFYERDYLYDAKFNMHLFPGLWNGGVDLGVGYEHRNIEVHQIPDPVQVAGDQLGFNQSPNTKSNQEVNSVFTELNIPIVTSTMNVSFIRSMEFSFAWRYEKFDDTDLLTKRTASFDNINHDEDFGGTPRISFRYQPIADITLRASWGQSFRSPTPSSLFDPVSQNFPVLFDPVNRVTLQPPLGVWQGGNTNLQPEKTDAYSAGIVWTPKYLPGFTMTADWYQLFTTDLILSPADNAQVLLSLGRLDPDGCGNGSNAAECPGFNTTADGVGRDAQGNLSWVDADFGNAGKRLVQGLDVTAVYEVPTEHYGKFTWSGGWNHFFTWKAQANPSQGYHNFLGDYNNGTFPLAPGAIPFNKGFLRGEWEWRHFDFVITGNYIGDFEDDPSFILGNDLVPGSPGTDPRDPPPANPSWQDHRRVTSYITMDMQLSYEWVKPAVEPPTYAKDAKDSKNVMQTAADTSTIWQRMLWGTKLTVGVNDVFDRQPPSVIGAFNDNYDTSLYSIRNRYYYIGFNKKF
jgi:iron complex outermembrane recepter protein